MNHLEFNLGLSELEANITTEDRTVAYTPEQKDLMWEEFRTLNIGTWNDLIAELRRRYSWLPKTSHFYNVLKEAESEEGGGIRRDIRYVDEPCSLCNRAGVRWGIFRDPERQPEWYTAVAKCSCRNAENFHRGVPTMPMVESAKDSKFIEWAPAGRVGVAMEALKKQFETKAEEVVAEEVPDERIPF